MRIYEKPEAEKISLVAKEAITGGDDWILDGEAGVESSEFD